MKRIIPIFLALFLPLFAGAQESDFFGCWNSLTVAKKWDRVSAMLYSEYRSKYDLNTLDCWFVRPVVGYQMLPWLKGEAAYEYYVDPAGPRHRALFFLTESISEGRLSLALRQCYMYGYSVGTSRTSNTFRSRAKLQYAVPESCFRPYLMTETFAWAGWQKVRQYAGTQISLGEYGLLDLYYMYQSFAGSAAAEHVAGLGYRFDL